MGAMVMNLASNVLGLGNAATPFGLKAMVELNRLNRHPGVATDAMVAVPRDQRDLRHADGADRHDGGARGRRLGVSARDLDPDADRHHLLDAVGVLVVYLAARAARAMPCGRSPSGGGRGAPPWPRRDSARRHAARGRRQSPARSALACAIASRCSRRSSGSSRRRGAGVPAGAPARRRDGIADQWLIAAARRWGCCSSVSRRACASTSRWWPARARGSTSRCASCPIWSRSSSRSGCSARRVRST